MTATTSRTGRTIILLTDIKNVTVFYLLYISGNICEKAGEKNYGVLWTTGLAGWRIFCLRYLERQKHDHSDHFHNVPHHISNLSIDRACRSYFKVSVF